MQLPYPCKYKGFTLIELMVVVSILAIVSGIMIPSFSTYTRNQTLKQAQENFKSDLRSIQNRALTGASSDVTLGGNLVKYWGVNFVANSSTYTSLIASSAACAGGTTQLVQTFSLPATVSFSSTSGGCYLFSMDDGSIYNTSGSRIGTVPIDLVNTSSATRTVTINGAGLIYSSN